jgi:outer membrane protein insertion porin family/translocation and assembly module TamA
VARVAVVILLGVVSSACKDDGQGIVVKALSFEGVKAVSEKQLKAVLSTAASDKLPWGEKRYFSREEFEADLKRIEAYYSDRGYPGAKVMAFDVNVSDDQESVKLVVTISEGEPIRIDRITFSGFGVLPEKHRQELAAKLPLAEGQPLDRTLLQASREAALDELRDHGYPYASVRIIEEVGARPRSRALTFDAEAGPAAYFGPVEVSGNSSVSDDVLRRRLAFRPGEIYQQSKLHESQRRLYQLELFEFVNVDSRRLDARPAEIPTHVTVTEGKHRKVDLGVGYGSEEKARAEIDWRHVNFFGGARTATVHGRWSSLDRGVRLGLRQPDLFGSLSALNLTGQVWHTDEPAFVLDTVGGRVTFTRDFSQSGGPVLGTRPTTSISFTYANEWEDYSISSEALNDPTFRDDLISLGLDPRFGTGGGQLSALMFDAGRNTTANLLDARKGYVAILHVERAGGWLQGDWTYTELTGEGRYYHSFGDRAVLAVRARAGSIDAAGLAELNVPFFKRYFLGGATTLRGWGRFEVAPLGLTSQPIGGFTFTNFSAELRVPIIGNFGGVVFVDGGNVWRGSWDINLDDLRYDVGPGIRYDTPIGPLRVDVGFQLNHIPGLIIDGEPEKRHFRVHFSIGHAF